MSVAIPRLVVSVPSADLVQGLGTLPEGVELIEWAMESDAPRDEIDIVVPPYMKASALFPRLSGVRVRLVQGQSIGYEGVADYLPDGIRFANAASVHETSTAELAVGLAIAAQRHIPDFVRAQAEGRWAPVHTQSLADRRVLLLGYGGVGKAIAARLQPFEVEITAVASRARVEDGVSIHAVAELGELLPQAEIVIVSLPGGAATERIVDAGFLAAMPDGGLLINVGRGSLVDTDALVAEVASGRLRAALDVTSPEPLPADHPLWSLPGALISPHVGGDTSAMRPRVAKLVRRQIERMLAGEEPLNVVIG